MNFMTASKIRAADIPDRLQLARMRSLLWPEASLEEHLAEVDTLLTVKTCGNFPIAIFAAEQGDGSLVGFLEVGMRSHADGCNPSQPVGFVEGWFVDEPFRSSGVGKQLMTAAEDWARAQGCHEIASDTWLDNEPSQRAHEALGFEVVDRCVHFRKAL
jgi:aminoglycoside 6'-N-acetyltransferase I